MKLSSDQLKVFRQVQDNQQGFADYMLGHLKKHFPVHCRLLGDDKLPVFVEWGIGTAISHHFFDRSQCCLYIDLMVMLGSGFDSDIQLPWANEILGKEMNGPDARIDLLYKTAMNYLDAVVGKSYVFPLVQMEQLAAMPVNPETGEIPDGSFSQELLPDLFDFWTPKYRVAGKQALQQLIINAVEKAASYGFRGQNSIAWLVLLQFLFGHNIDSDPLYPWVKEFLGQSLDIPEEKKFVMFQELVKKKLLEGIENEMALF
jgi:hypothetical protein